MCTWTTASLFGAISLWFDCYFECCALAGEQRMRCRPQTLWSFWFASRNRGFLAQTKKIADSKDENETFPSVFVLTQHFHVLNPPFQWDVKAWKLKQKKFVSKLKTDPFQLCQSTSIFLVNEFLFEYSYAIFSVHTTAVVLKLYTTRTLSNAGETIKKSSFSMRYYNEWILKQ